MSLQAKLVLAAGLLAMVMALAIRSPLLYVGEVDVEGAENISKGAILTQAGVSPGMMVWEIDEEQAKQRLLRHDEIADARLEWRWLGRLYIWVRERPIVASRYVEGGFIPLTSGGRWLPHRMDKPPGPIWEPKEQESSLLPRDIAQQLAKLPTVLRERVARVTSTRWLGGVKLVIPPHKVIVRLSDLAIRLPWYYAHFRQHPPGTIYLLDAIWFSPRS